MGHESRFRYDLVIGNVGLARYLLVGEGCPTVKLWCSYGSFYPKEGGGFGWGLM